MKNTICCVLQNRLGALDRVLGALTHRGFLPEEMIVRKDRETNRMRVYLTFDCPEDKILEKLVKFLHKQVYVIEIQWLWTGELEENLSLEAEAAEQAFTSRRSASVPQPASVIPLYA